MYFAYMFGFISFIKLEEDSLQVPLYTKEVHQWKWNEASNFKEKLIVNLMFYFIKFLNFISKPLFFHLKKRGI